MIPRWLKITPGIVLFFLMLVFPAASNMFPIKAALLAVVFVSCLLLWMDQLHISQEIGFITLAMSAIGAFFCVLGAMRGTPGATSCITVYVLWPLVYLVIISGIRHDSMFRSLDKAVLWSCAAVVLLGFGFYLSALGLIPDVPLLNEILKPEEIGFSMGDGYTRLAIPGLNTMSFLTPFLMAVLVSRKYGRKLRVALWAILVLGCILILFSGRRAMEIIMLASPLIIFAISRFQPDSDRRKTRESLIRAVAVLALLIGVAIPVFGSAYGITFSGITDRFMAAFDFSMNSSDDSPQARTEQTHALLKEWEQRPIIGAGFGATSHGSLRSEETPWAYELYYLALLFQTGIIGLGAYCLAVLWIYYSAVRIIKAGGQAAQIMFPVLVGMTGFLIASASNPYLSKFDGLWVIFLPVAIINHWKLSPEFRGALMPVPEHS